MTKKVFSIDTQPGIQRDGTVTDRNLYNDGRWVRFQRKRPRKILGYREITNSLCGPSRGIFVDPENQFSNVFNGYADGLQSVQINNIGIGAGVHDFTLSGFVPSDNNLWQFDALYNVSGGEGTLLAHAGQNLASINNQNNTRVLSGNEVGYDLSPVGVFELTASTNGTNTITLAGTSLLVGAGQSITGAGIPSDTSVVSITNGDTVVLSKSTTTITSTTKVLDSVAVTGTAGQISFTATTGVVVGQPVTVTGTLTGTATGISAGTYYIVVTNGTSTATLSTTIGGSGITTTAGTTVGLGFSVPTNVLGSVAVTGTAGQFSCTTSSTLAVGQVVVVLGTNSGTATGISAGGYYIIATNGTTTFTLSATLNGPAITTTAGTTTGLVFNLYSYLTFDNNVSVSGGVVVLHPYTFVYGNRGLIKNSAAGNPDDWVSADANETNVSSTKIVKGLPVRGGTNSPSGLFWSLDSLIRVSYTPTTVTVGTTSNTFYWRYDIISSQSSILSSQCVIEYDGIYYWIGIDRFLSYNGVVKEIPNETNQNHFFDNLNYNQRQKVYANKVPRYGEIWWFYPRGDSTECNDAIIYNVRENVWYDVGEALGARRSAGYFSQVFAYPINASTDPYTTGAISLINIVNDGSAYTDGTYDFVELEGGTGGNAFASLVVSGGAVTSITMTNRGIGYTAGDLMTASLPGGSGLVLYVEKITDLITLFQHEFGTDAIIGGNQLAIESYFETNNLGWVSGGPAQASLAGENLWIRLERIEPDFVLSGNLDLYITGRPYAQSDDKTTGPYTFDANTNKIDMKEQRRELRLRFVSNQVGGNYQLGYLILNADSGDVRGY